MGANDAVSSVAISQDGSTIVAGAGSVVSLLDQQGTTLWKAAAGSSVNGVGISPEGSYVGVAADKLYLFDRDGNLLWTEKTTFIYRDVALSSDGEYIAATCDNGAIFIFDRNQEQLWDYDMGTDSYGIAISENGRKIAIGCDNGGVYYLNSREGESWSYGTGKRVEGIALTPDAWFVAAGSLDRCVYLSTGEGEHLWKYPTGDAVRSTALTNEASEIFAASGRTVFVLDRAGIELQQIALDGRVESVAVTPDGSFLTIGGGDDDRFIRLFTNDATFIENGNSTETAVNETDPLDGVSGDVTAPPYSADDRMGAAAEPDTQDNSIPSLVLGWVENVLALLFKPQEGFLA
ncbi:WD40 repeat domain-containing protein [Methanoculleus sp.]|uniref:WD40 repeat domain-containing protein n=1 Tax=Methanoculleus sp. TaxID=90427 RepID=UPI0025F9FE88|nr:WD40 repeat domain-containing protein [Methanoculleus sp.]MCK9316951.1 WD40 repeat domain-containing protein [Methanoculleus sp.]MDD2252827.1 WD40 repeat domain-containing protein [Methanoculleus sp.]MDD4469824.1 WD40 repeat domain-containing protein [Methanoculleus sp.]